MKGKNVIITGGNDGIGFQTALQLARMGAALMLVCRNEQKAKHAVEEIQASSGNDRIQYVIADLSKQQSIRKVAEQIRNRADKIDVLINNAGAAFRNFSLTEDGLEMTIATNHFSFFLLTGLLLDLIRNSGAGRIVNVSSDSHYRGKIDFESFTKNKNYFIRSAYAQSKLANVLFTFELAERLKYTGITVNCLHPGFVKTRIGNKPGKLSSLVWSFLTLFAISPQAGATTSVFLAQSPEVNGITGKYFNRCKPVNPNPLANDAALKKALWKESEKYCGFSYPSIG
ncbi:MAG TPA: SDR family oxidoreductase [Chitinophagales bacterium]|nr:SDR family oxidoreductase [Chitinophagales bacterium]